MVAFLKYPRSLFRQLWLKRAYLFYSHGDLNLYATAFGGPESGFGVSHQTISDLFRGRMLLSSILRFCRDNSIAGPKRAPPATHIAWRRCCSLLDRRRNSASFILDGP